MVLSRTSAAEIRASSMWNTCGGVTKKLAGQAIPQAATAWLGRVESHADYQTLRRNARDQLTHRFLVRSALIGSGRTPFELDRAAPPENRPDARELILLALNVADRHVDEFGRTLGVAGYHHHHDPLE